MNAVALLEPVETAAAAVAIVPVNIGPERMIKVYLEVPIHSIEFQTAEDTLCSVAMAPEYPRKSR